MSRSLDALTESGPVPARDVWHRRFLLFLAGVVAWRLLYLIAAPLDLAPDEAYYWDWSRRLAWGYYSKPPLIAWLIALSTRVLGTSAFAVRLPAVVLSAVGLWAIYALGRRMFDARAGFWAAVLAAASPLASALGFVMTIDAPVVCYWSVALYTLWRACEDRPGRMHWWAAAGVVTCLGILAKFIMPVMLVLFPFLACLDPRIRATLRRPGPYVWLALALVSLVPVLAWNAGHEWVTFRHTAVHFDTHPAGVVSGALSFLESAGLQALAVSPVTWLLLVVLSCIGLWRWRRLQTPVRYLLAFSAVPLLCALLLGLRQRINGNWLAVFYPAGFILVAGWAMGNVSLGARADALRKAFRPAVAVGAVLAVLAYALPVVLPRAGVDVARMPQVRMLLGWRELGRRVSALYRDRERTFLVTTSRRVAGELAFYVEGRPTVYRWPGSQGAVSSQYEIWPGPRDKLGWDALIVLPLDDALPPDLADAFDAVEPAGTLDVPFGGGGRRRFALYWGRALRRWPGTNAGPETACIHRPAW